MKVKSKVVARYEDKGRLKAVATVCLDGKFLVTGVRVADCQKGLSVFMPSREIRAGEYRDICFPITSELYKQIKDSVLEAYARPEDDDPDYGDGFEVEEKAGQGEAAPVAAGQGRHGMAPGNSGKTGEAGEADAAVTPEGRILPDDGREAGDPGKGGRPGETVQPGDTPQPRQHGQWAGTE